MLAARKALKETKNKMSYAESVKSKMMMPDVRKTDIDKRTGREKGKWKNEGGIKQKSGKVRLENNERWKYKKMEL